MEGLDLARTEPITRRTRRPVQPQLLADTNATIASGHETSTFPAVRLFVFGVLAAIPGK
jgi:hypothetical protein